MEEGLKTKGQKPAWHSPQPPNTHFVPENSIFIGLQSC